MKTMTRVAAGTKLCLFGLSLFQSGRIRPSEGFLDERNSFQVPLSFTAVNFGTGHTGTVSVLCVVYQYKAD